MLRCASSVIVLSALIVSPVLAQASKPNSEPLALGEIVVTAQRSQTNLQNTPIAVTALSGQALTARGVTTLLDVQDSTPSLVVSSRSGTGSTEGGFTIRGIGQDGLGTSPAVGLYVDEVYYPSAAGNLLGLFDVDRIEVLRGPQGTLFGRNTIAGAVQYITTKPNQVFGGYLEGKYGNFGDAEFGGAVNFPVNDSLAIRVSGRYNKDGGFVHDDANNINRGEQVTEQGRVEVRWTPIPKLTVDLKGEGIHLDGNGRALAVTAFNSSLTPPGTPGGGAALVFAALGSGLNPASLFTITPSAHNYHFGGFNGPDNQTYDFHTGQATIAYDFSDNIKIKSITAYSYSADGELADLDNTPLPIVRANRGDISTDLITQELQISGRSLAGKLHFTVGGYLFDSNQANRNESIEFGTSPLIVPANGGDSRIKSFAIAAFGQATYDLTDKFSATAGIRYSQEQITGSFINTQFPNIAAPVDPIVLPSIFPTYKKSFDDVSPHFGLNYQADPSLLFYASASKGFRAGGVEVNGNLVNPAPPLPAITKTPGYAPYNPETAWTYELGARAQFLDRRVRFNPTVFYTSWKNIQFNDFVFNPNPNIITRNAGDARIWGVELEGQAQVTSQFMLTGSFSYLNGKYSNIDPGIDLTMNSPLQHTPKYKASVGGQYTMILPNGDKTVTNIDYSWTDAQRSAVTNADFINEPAYGLLNARLEYRPAGKPITVSVYGTNLTNKYYYIGGVNGFGTFATTEADLGRPREYGVNLRYNF